jgi:hypothetical protein
MVTEKSWNREVFNQKFYWGITISLDIGEIELKFNCDGNDTIEFLSIVDITVL